MSAPRASRAGLSTGDVLIVLAALTVVLALAYPTLSARAFHADLAETFAQVEAVRTVARAHRLERGSWPASGEPGALPSELAGALGRRDGTGTDGRATLQWTTWEVVDSVEAPPSAEQPPVDAPPETVPPAFLPLVRRVGAIVVHSADERVLAELLSRYGAKASFVRDTTWTLVLPERADGS